MYWTAAANIAAAKPYASEPDSPSALLSGKLRTSLQTLHEVYRKRISCLPAYEKIAALVEEGTADRVRLNELVRRNAMPRPFAEHPVVRSADSEPVAPVSVHVDAVPFSHTDSVVGFWQLPGSAHCAGAGGAGGAHGTLSSVVFALCQQGSVDRAPHLRWLSSRHVGSPWRASDSMRQGLSGNNAHEVRDCVRTLGSSSWSDSMRPCFLETPRSGSFVVGFYPCWF